MSLIRFLLATAASRLLERVSLALRTPTEVRLLPQEFLEELLRQVPDELMVSVVGPSMIPVFEFRVGGSIYSTALYREDEVNGVMPYIYRVLLHAAVEGGRPKVFNPMQVLSVNHFALVEYLGPGRANAAILSRQSAQPIAEA